MFTAFYFLNSLICEKFYEVHTKNKESNKKLHFPPKDPLRTDKLHGSAKCFVRLIQVEINCFAQRYIIVTQRFKLKIFNLALVQGFIYNQQTIPEP